MGLIKAKDYFRSFLIVCHREWKLFVYHNKRLIYLHDHVGLILSNNQPLNLVFFPICVHRDETVKDKIVLMQKTHSILEGPIKRFDKTPAKTLITGIEFKVWILLKIISDKVNACLCLLQRIMNLGQRRLLNNV